jgi:hypothetical protein
MRATPWLLAAGLTLGAGATAVSFAADSRPVERFTAFAMDLNGRAGRNTATVDIAIDHWSTDQERDRLLASLKEKGSDGLLKDLQKADEVGYIRTASSLGYPLRFAYQSALPGGGRRILIATDRRMSFLELTRNSRTRDYPFTIVELRLGPNGEGEGKLMPLARVTQYPDDVVEIETYDIQPVRLTNVKKAS